MFPLSQITALSFVFDACVHYIFHGDFDITKVYTLYVFKSA